MASTRRGYDKNLNRQLPQHYAWLSAERANSFSRAGLCARLIARWAALADQLSTDSESKGAASSTPLGLHGARKIAAEVGAGRQPGRRPHGLRVCAQRAPRVLMFAPTQ